MDYCATRSWVIITTAILAWHISGIETEIYYGKMTERESISFQIKCVVKNVWVKNLRVELLSSNTRKWSCSSFALPRTAYRDSEQVHWDKDVQLGHAWEALSIQTRDREQKCVWMYSCISRTSVHLLVCGMHILGTHCNYSTNLLYKAHDVQMKERTMTDVLYANLYK